MAAKANFQQQLKKLEAIIDWFEKEDVDLDEAISKFEEGIKLASELKGYLEEAQNKVEQIKVRFDQRLAADTQQPAGEQ